MNFLYPLFLAGAVAAAIPIALHFLRREITPEVPFSAVRFLRGSPVPQAERRRLRDLFLLIARVVALLLLAAAFARPYLRGTVSAEARIRIIAVDRSFSMAAPDRFAAAITHARAAVNEAGVGERIAVMAFDEGADVLGEPGPPAAARAALARIHPSLRGTRFGPLFARASQLAAQSPGRLIVITDLQRAGWDDRHSESLPADLQVEVRDTGPPPPNLAVVGVRVAPNQVVASIRNTGREPRAGQVRVERAGRIVATAGYSASGEAITAVPISYDVPDGGALSVAIEDREGFPADNTRFLSLDAARSDAVLIVTSGAASSGMYVSRALAAGIPAEDPDRALERDAGARALSSGDLSAYSAVALLSTRGLARPGRDAIAAFVRSGGGVFIAASPDVEPLVLSTMFDLGDALSGVETASSARSLSVTDPRHPIFLPFASLAANLGRIRFDSAWRIPSSGWAVAARFSDGAPALLERSVGRGRLALFASDLDRRWNDFPVHVSFVPFIVEAMRYVSTAADRRLEYTVSSVPPGVPSTPGVHGQPGALVAVNIDPRESETSTVTPAEFAAMIARAPDTSKGRDNVPARTAEARQSYWQWGLLLMIGALVAESFIGRA